MRGQPFTTKKYTTFKTQIKKHSLFVVSVFALGLMIGSILSPHHEPPPPVGYSTSHEDDAISRQHEANMRRKLVAAERWKPKKFDAEVECLAKNMYFEARNQDIQGQAAVGLVTINRVLSTKYPNTICGVVWQKNWSRKAGKWVAQFSWTWDGKPDRPKNKEVWGRVYNIARTMLDGRTLLNFEDFTDGSTHYHADYVKPSWSKRLTLTTVVGDHVFYRDEKATPIIPVVVRR